MRRIRNTRFIGALLACVMLASMFAGLPQTARAATTIYVPDNYSTIQAAVDAASPGDTIIVRDGTYAENVDVNKDHLTIQSEKGADKTTVQAANPDDHVFEVTAAYSSISGFTIQGSGGYPNSGIFIGGSHNHIFNNHILSNPYVGIYIKGPANQVCSNKVSGSGMGIYLYNHADNNIISNNDVRDTDDWDLALSLSNKNTITGNYLGKSHGGIGLGFNCCDNLISKNTIEEAWNGIELFLGSDRNTIFNNDISKGLNGIVVQEVENCIIRENNILKNEYHGICLSSSASANMIFLNNLIDNGDNALSSNLTNTWNSPEEISYAYSGNTYTSYLGNYWSDYTGSDATGDGIGDTPYPIDLDNDNYPLMEPFENYDRVVTFPDANLEAAIREALPKPVGDIYASELACLTGLDAEGRGIVNLSGLEYCTNLVWLHLSHNQISNLTPLAGLTSLTQLWVISNQISDIAPLAGLTSLTSLLLNENQISDLAPLAGLTSLADLWLSSNQISDITPLAGLTSLTSLLLDYNQISDLTPLAGLTGLTQLWLSYNQITDITPLAGLTSLTVLLLSDNQISDLTPLERLTSLVILTLYSNQISDLTPLADLTGLTALALYSNQISDLTPLAGLTSLIDLNLRYNQISDITPLAGLTSLTSLLLNENQISDLAPLDGLTSLATLWLQSNQISDIAPLVSNTGLATGDAVDLRGNPLSQTSVNVHIPALQARGVIVVWDDVAPAAITLAANPKSITANDSSTSTITATVKDDQGNNVLDGTIVVFTTSAGSIGSTTVQKSTTNGVATATLTSSKTDGVATVTATSGDAAAATAVFFTRPGVTVTDFIEEETPPGQYTVDAKSLGDIEVIKSGDGTPTLTVAKYSRNPAGPNPGGFSVAGDYVDVHLSSTDNVTQIEIRKYYTDDEIRGMRETTLRMRWWSGSGWVECSNSGVNTNNVNGYSGYVWAIITDDTTPCLADLSGGMFAAMGTATITPSAPTTSPSASRASPTPPRPLNPAQMSVQYLSINPQRINANQPITITTNVVNIGDQADNLNVALKINGKVEQARMVSVGSRGTQPVKFTVSRAQPGTYTVDIGGQKGSFTVLGAYSSNSGASTAAGLIATLIAGLLVIVVVMLFRRRAY